MADRIYMFTVRYTATRTVERFVWERDGDEGGYFTVEDEPYEVPVAVYREADGTYTGYAASGLLWGPYPSLKAMEKDHPDLFASLDRP